MYDPGKNILNKWCVQESIKIIMSKIDAIGKLLASSPWKDENGQSAEKTRPNL
jgi:hypothetical protein